MFSGKHKTHFTFSPTPLHRNSWRDCAVSFPGSGKRAPAHNVQEQQLKCQLFGL